MDRKELEKLLMQMFEEMFTLAKPLCPGLDHLSMFCIEDEEGKHVNLTAWAGDESLMNANISPDGMHTRLNCECENEVEVGA